MISILEFPEFCAAFYPVEIGEDMNVGVGGDVEFADTAAADIEAIVIEYDFEDLQDLCHPLIPFFLSFFLEGFCADVDVVVAALADGVMGEFEVRKQVAIDEDGGAEAGAEGDGE